jgi:hypothetical protein
VIGSYVELGIYLFRLIDRVWLDVSSSSDRVRIQSLCMESSSPFPN